MGKPKGGSSINTPLKGQISRYYQRPTLQIDSAGGHGIARGHGNFTELKAMMLEDFNVDLEQQPWVTPFRNVLGPHDLSSEAA